ncbi:MAG: hypothetical protein U1E78_06035 [Gammaproteobacteria bacterium]
MQIDFSNWPTLISRHFYHKVVLTGLSLLFVFSPFSLLRYLFGGGIVAAMVNLFRTEWQEQGFFDAIRDHQLERFKTLMREHPELADARDSNGMPTISLAIQSYDPNFPESIEIFQQLRKKTKHLHTADQQYGRTPLHWAYHLAPTLAPQLGVQDTNVEDYDGCTPVELGQISNIDRKNLLP